MKIIHMSQAVMSAILLLWMNFIIIGGEVFATEQIVLNLNHESYEIRREAEKQISNNLELIELGRKHHITHIRRSCDMMYFRFFREFEDTLSIWFLPVHIRYEFDYDAGEIYYERAAAMLTVAGKSHYGMDDYDCGKLAVYLFMQDYARRYPKETLLELLQEMYSLRDTFYQSINAETGYFYYNYPPPIELRILGYHNFIN